MNERERRAYLEATARQTARQEKYAAVYTFVNTHFFDRILKQAAEAEEYHKARRRVADLLYDLNRLDAMLIDALDEKRIEFEESRRV